MKYTATKKNKLLPFIATWVDLKNIILSEIRQRKTTHLYVDSKNTKKKKDYKKSRLAVMGGQYRGGGI